MRSSWKIPNIEQNLFLKKKGRFLCKRSAIILPVFIGLTTYVHSGLSYRLLKISSKMVGFKFGEFKFTRRVSSGLRMHVYKKIKKKLKKK